MTKKLWIGAGLIGLAAVTLVAGKAGWFDGLRDQNKVLRSRVEGYWQARLAGDLEGLEKYQHPLQDGNPASDMLVTDAYTIEGLEIRGDAALGTIRVRSHLKQPHLAARTRENVLKSKWVRYEGEWYQAVAPTNLKEVLQDAQRRMHPEEVASSEASTAPLANKGVEINEELRSN